MEPGYIRDYGRYVGRRSLSANIGEEQLRMIEAYIDREDGWTLEYGDLCLNAGTLSDEGVSPAASLVRIMDALRNGWLLEENDEEWEDVPCTRLALEQTGASGGDMVTTVWLRQTDGTPLYGEIAVDGETILQVRFTNFAFCDTITETS